MASRFFALLRASLRFFARGAVTMLAGDEFISSPPKKTVRFGGTLTDILLKYQRVSARQGAAALRVGEVSW